MKVESETLEAWNCDLKWTVKRHKKHRDRLRKKITQLEFDLNEITLFHKTYRQVIRSQGWEPKQQEIKI